MGFLKKFKDYLMSDEEDDIPKNSNEPSDETEAVRTEKKKKVKKLLSHKRKKIYHLPLQKKILWRMSAPQ